MWKRIHALSLQKKLMISIAVCLLLPSVVSFSVSNWLTQDVVREQTARYGRESLEIVGQYVRTHINQMINLLNLIQFDEELQLAVTQLGKAGDETDPADIAMNKMLITQRLDPRINSYGTLYFTILLPNRDIVTNYGTFNMDKDQLFRKEWVEAASGLNVYQLYWIGTEPNYAPLRTVDKTQPYLLSIAKPIKSGSVLRGIAVVSLEIPELQELFSRAREDESFYLIDNRDRVVLSESNPPFGHVFPYAEHIPAVGGTSFFDGGGEALIVQTEQISQEWRLVSLNSYKEVSRPMEAIRRTDFIIQAVLLVFFAVILLSVAGALTNPIRRLVQTVVQIESGQLGRRSGIRGEDEVGRLGYVFDRMLDRIEQMVASIVREQEQKRAAELAMLQAQTNPHFLFNVLNSIRMRILMRGDTDNAELLSSLSSLLRMTINRNNEFITLREEMDINRHYVQLVNFRHAGDLVLEIDITPEAYEAEIPRFLLQPLIENAYLHGLKRKGGTIRFQAQVGGGVLTMVISDNGCGMTGERLEQVRAYVAGGGDADEAREEASVSSLSGIGIRNVYERIRLIYGDQGQFGIEAEPDRGTRITLQLPAKRQGAS